MKSKRLSQRVTLVVLTVACVAATLHVAQDSFASMSVYVVDDQTGNPVNDGFVTLVPDMETQGRLMKSGREMDSGFVFAEGGKFDFEGGGVYNHSKIVFGDFILWVRAHGYAPQFLPMPIYSEGPLRQVVELQKSAVVTGRVTDEAGNPLFGAAVMLTCTDEEILSTYVEMSNRSTFGGTQTDKLGNFEIDSGVIPETTFVLEVSHPEFLPVLSGENLAKSDAPNRVDVTLSRKGTALSGRILDAKGNPVAEADVALVIQHPESVTVGNRKIPFIGGGLFFDMAPYHWERHHPKAKTGLDGRFEFKNLPQGSAMIRVRALGFRPLQQNLELVEDGAYFEFTLQDIGRKEAPGDRYPVK